MNQRAFLGSLCSGSCGGEEKGNLLMDGQYAR